MSVMQKQRQKVTTMKFETVADMMAWMSAARDSVLVNAACEVNWVHRKTCPTLVEARARGDLSRGGADQTCACRPYAMLLIRHGEAS